jgi:hypothetical protein
MCDTEEKEGKIFYCTTKTVIFIIRTSHKKERERLFAGGILFYGFHIISNVLSRTHSALYILFFGNCLFSEPIFSMRMNALFVCAIVRRERATVGNRKAHFGFCVKFYALTAIGFNENDKLSFCLLHLMTARRAHFCGFSLFPMLINW